MATATLVRPVAGFAGADATLYRLDPPIAETDEHGRTVAEHDHVIVYTTPPVGHVRAEGKLFPATAEGVVKGYTMKALVRYSHGYAPNHAGVMFLAGGYEIVDETGGAA